MSPAIHLKIVGCILLALACCHVVFPRYFQWKQELARLSLINRQIFLVHVGFIILLLILLGVLNVLFTDALLEGTQLAAVVNAGIAIFWGIRLLTQWLVYSPKHWIGKPLHTGIHLGWSAALAYFVIVHLWAMRTAI